MMLSEALFLIAVVGVLFSLAWVCLRFPLVIFGILMIMTVYFTGNFNEYLPRNLWW